MGKKKNTNSEKDNLQVVPILALENNAIVPMIPQPLKIDNPEQKEFLDKCQPRHNTIFVATTMPLGEEDPDSQELRKIGLLCILDRVMQMPGAPTLAFLRPVSRALFHEMVFSKEYPLCKISLLDNVTPPKRVGKNIAFMAQRIGSLFDSVMSFVPDQEREASLKLVSEHAFDPVAHLYAMCHVAPLDWEEKYQLIICSKFSELQQTVALVLDEAEQRIKLQAAIHEKTHRELSEQQKDAFLRLHLKHVREELGETDENDDINFLLKKADKAVWNEDAKKHFEKELRKLQRLNINNPEYSIQFAYLETLLDLPWNNYNKEDISIPKVKEILDRDHYGLENVKERILEHMAVLKLRDDLKAPIICLYGPPGVGKTSVGKSIAEATGREYARIALGGLHDESEIRGHRKTYIGAMPGRFIHSLSKLKFGNPLILLDEIDKVGKDYKGDPASALLEALDPEQNHTFHDNFIDFPYDLSKVLFVATANDISTIPAPLRDRMEIIEMKAYTPEEKREIALQHLANLVLTDNGFQPNEITFTPDAIDAIVKKFTKESGVRQLKMQMSKIIRKLALLKVKGEDYPTKITPALVDSYLNKKDIWHNRLGFQG